MFSLWSLLVVWSRSLILREHSTFSFSLLFLSCSHFCSSLFFSCRMAFSSSSAFLAVCSSVCAVERVLCLVQFLHKDHMTVVAMKHEIYSI